MKTSKNRLIDPVLIGISLLAAFLNLYGIWRDEYANSYYTAAVASMLQGFHNFFFASFDPGGFVTVDKPPVAFWIQTISASIFGLHGWSVILPQALAGVGSVVLIYILVKPSFGRTAARLSALVAACTPVAAAVSRTNNVDSLLVFTLLLATWLLFKAVKTHKWGWSAAAFAVIGVGFNIKMLQAYMVLPAFYMFFWLAMKVSWRQKLKALAASTVVLLAVSFSWPLIVDSVPKENRPYIGSSQTNSVLELAFGYNGLSRLTGMGGPGGANRGGERPNIDVGNMPNDGQQWQQPPGQDGAGQTPPSDGPNARGTLDGGAPQDGGGGGAFNTGTPGPLRLFQSQLSGQISWLLPFSLLSAVGLLMGWRRKQQLTEKQTESLFWLAWLLPMMGFFSVAGFFHQYYLIMLAPAIAALTGAGWVELYSFYRNREGWRRWLLPAGILGTTLFQIYILLPYQTQIGLGWPVAVGALGVGLALVLCLPKISRAAAVGGILVLLAAPLYWSATPLLYGGDSMLPEAGPSMRSAWNRAGMPGLGSGQIQGQIQGQMPGQMTGRMPGQGQDSVNTRLLEFLSANNTGEKYLFATTDSHTASPYIIQTGKAVMAMGGFSGSDPILTVDKLQEMVKNKEVKYFLISGGGFGRGGSSEVLNWIRQNGKEVPAETWQAGTGSVLEGPARDGSMTLYEVNP